MRLSHSELGALCKKATRGVGYSWGLAEDAATQVLTLNQRGYDGCAALRELLDYCSQHGLPAAPNPDFSPKAEAICALLLNAYLNDSGQSDLDVSTIYHGQVIAETLVCPQRLPQRDHRIALDDATIKALGVYAFNCYAPDTEASRQKGAGAGLSDND